MMILPQMCARAPALASAWAPPTIFPTCLAPRNELFSTRPLFGSQVLVPAPPKEHYHTVLICVQEVALTGPLRSLCPPAAGETPLCDRGIPYATSESHAQVAYAKRLLRAQC